MLGKPFSDSGRLELDDPRLAPAVDAVRRAVADVLEQIEAYALREEEPITERLAQAIRFEIAHLPRAEGVEWSVELPATSKYHERDHGADLAVVADLQIGDYHAKKGFVLQFKRAERLADERDKLRKQAALMLRYTPAAAVAIVDPPAGILAIPARDADRPDFPARERAVPLEDVFRAHFACAFGDPRLGDLRTVIEQLEPRRLIEVKARTVW